MNSKTNYFENTITNETNLIKSDKVSLLQCYIILLADLLKIYIKSFDLRFDIVL